MRFKRKGTEHTSIKEIKLSDETIIGIFEGSRGYKPEHDILIKYQEQGKKIWLLTIGPHDKSYDQFRKRLHSLRTKYGLV